MAIKGELFSTDMVRAFLDNRKSRTSRPIKYKFKNIYGVACVYGKWSETYGSCIPDSLLEWYVKNFAKSKYQPGDIMYARETFGISKEKFHRIVYRTDLQFPEGRPRETIENERWKSPYAMKREAARLFFRVTDVKLQRLEDMTEQDAIEDGFYATPGKINHRTGTCIKLPQTVLENFKEFWFNQYGSNSNWMWVYYLRQISKDEALKS